MACSTAATKKALAEAGVDPFEIAALAIERVERLEAQLLQLSAILQRGSERSKHKLMPRSKKLGGALFSPL